MLGPMLDASAAPAAPTLGDRLRGFGPLGLLAIVLVFIVGNGVLPIGGLLVLAWARITRTPWRDLGFVRPRNWPLTIAGAVLFGAAFKLVMKSLVMPLLGAAPVNPHYHFLTGNLAALPQMLWIVAGGAGFGEETVFRGFAFERLRRLLGRGPRATVATIGITSAVFGIAHLSGQGWTGVEQATVVGLVYGAIYARSGRLPFLMIAHAAFDLTAVAMIFWNLEERFAHAIFH